MALNYKIGRAVSEQEVPMSLRRGKWVPVRKAVDATPAGQWLPVTLENGEALLLQRNVFSWTHRPGASRTYHARISGETVYISWEANNDTQP